MAVECYKDSKGSSVWFHHFVPERALHDTTGRYAVGRYLFSVKDMEEAMIIIKIANNSI